jgi:hypothetical protein
MTPSEGPLRRVVPFEPRDGSAPIRSGGSIEASGPGASAPREPRGVPRLRRDRRSIEPAGRSRSSWVYAAVEFPERPDREPSPWPPWTLSSSPVSRSPTSGQRPAGSSRGLDASARAPSSGSSLDRGRSRAPPVMLRGNSRWGSSGVEIDAGRHYGGSARPLAPFVPMARENPRGEFPPVDWDRPRDSPTLRLGVRELSCRWCRRRGSGGVRRPVPSARAWPLPSALHGDSHSRRRRGLACSVGSDSLLRAGPHDCICPGDDGAIRGAGRERTLLRASPGRSRSDGIEMGARAVRRRGLPAAGVHSGRD